MKENVICGHLIPAGTGLPLFRDIIVGSKDEYQEAIEPSYADMDF